MGVWYRTGTAAVTNGSAAVVGTGTLWATQASVGDIFVGPDVANYEITSITDDTHLAVKQLNGTAAYAGATLSAQPYAIIRNFTSTLPAQLASQLAAMMTAWHVTTDELTAWLSGSGTVPVHDSIGNVYNVQTPAALNATLSGRLSKSVAGAANVALTTSEASNLFVELTGVLTDNIAVIVPTSARSYFVANLTSGAFTVTVKTAAGTGIAVPQAGRVLLECDATNVIDPLTKKAASGANSDITSLSALTTALSIAQGGTGAVTANAAADALGAFRKGSILGTVSQTAGVPTGAIIERGSNANGEYVRFADGTQICMQRDETASFITSMASGNVWEVSAAVVFTFPIQFIAPPVMHSSTHTAVNAVAWASNYTVTATVVAITAWSPASTAQGKFQYTAIGRWF